jgi:hypothetical protein
VQLTKVQETLMIPLYAKALDFRSKASILHEEQANRIVALVEYDSEKVRQGFGRDLLIVRAKQFDEWIRYFIKGNPECIVLHAGFGLDGRIERIDPPATVRWFDLDYPEVIELREKFYQPREGYRMLGMSLAGLPNDRPDGTRHRAATSAIGVYPRATVSVTTDLCHHGAHSEIQEAAALIAVSILTLATAPGPAGRFPEARSNRSDPRRQ